MRHVRCLFRVLGVAQKYDNSLVVEIAPTYATRDNVQSEENKAFWEATPNGKGELTLHHEAPGAALFRAGAYLYLDLFNAEPAEDHQVPAGGIRTDWILEEIRVRPCDFAPKIVAASGPWDGVTHTHKHGRNADLFSGWPARGEMSFQVNNIQAWPFFAIVPSPQEARDMRPRIVIDFSPA